MKKICIYLSLIIFGFQISSYADDIKDFEIAGISIGDSALDFYTEDEIKSAPTLPFKSDKYITFTVWAKDNEIYELVEIAYKKKDKKYTIVGLSGGNYVTNKKDCIEQKDEIAESVKDLFSKSQSMSDEQIHPLDPTGKTKFYRTAFQVNPKSKYMEIEVSCVFFGDEMISQGYQSNVGMTIKTDKYNHWLTHGAY